MQINKKTLLGWFLWGMVGLAVFLAYYDHAFPTASININISREEAVEKAVNFLEKEGFS